MTKSTGHHSRVSRFNSQYPYHIPAPKPSVTLIPEDICPLFWPLLALHAHVADVKASKTPIPTHKTGSKL